MASGRPPVSWRKTKIRGAVWAFLLAAVAACLQSLPGTNVLSFYFCFVMAPILAVACGGVAVTVFAEAREGSTLAGAWLRALGLAALFTAIPLVVVLINAFRVPQCDVQYGMLYYLMGPTMAALCGVCASATISSFVRKPRLAHFVFILVVLLSFGVNLFDIYYQPAVFFYNPFLGLYPGAIYDVKLEVGTAYIAFRLFCCAVIACAIGSVIIVLDNNFSKKLPRSVWPFLFFGLCAGVAGGLWRQADFLGFRVTRATVESVLEKVAFNGFCEVRADPSVDQGQLYRLLDDCAFRHVQIATFFGVSAQRPVRIYLYKDEEQKATLMGARETEISKPWLGEVHMVLPSPGDQTLAHEIAHVVAGRLSRNILAMPLRFGVVPDMPLVEGLAVAAAFVGEGPSPHEWSLAMLRAGVLANPAEIWRTDKFLFSQSERAYVVAGSFVRFLGERFGLEAMQEIAQGVGVEEATRMSWEELVKEWRAHLEDAGGWVDWDLVRRAERRFSGPGVLERRCPQDVERLVAGARQAQSRGDYVGSLSLLERALELAPEDQGIRRARLLALAWTGAEKAVREASFVLRESVDFEDLVTLVDALAILALAKGEAPGFEASWVLREAEDLAPKGPQRRAVMVRREVLGLEPESALLVYRVILGLEPVPAAALLEALARVSDCATVNYLLGRAFVGQGDYAAAIWHLERALFLGLPGADVEFEAIRLLGESLYWQGRFDESRQYLLQALEMARYEGERLRVEELFERMNFTGLGSGTVFGQVGQMSKVDECGRTKSL